MNALTKPTYRVDDLETFLQYVADKGLANKQTSSSRRAAVGKVFGILDDAEREDVREIDIDEVFMRFVNLHGTDYKPESIQVYKSRVSKAIDDFLRYREDPISFRAARPMRVTVSKAKGKPTGTKVLTASRIDESDRKDEMKLPAVRQTETVNVPVPIRPGHVVQLMDVPYDLTEAEASKIARIVEALATE